MMRLSLIALIVALAGCLSNEPPPELPVVSAGADSQVQPAPSPGSVTPTTLPVPLIPQPPVGPSFTRDILPLLSSTATGRVYKCTVCHRAYTDYETVRNPERLNKILTHAGPAGSMPPNGDKMNASDLNLLLEWQRAGYQP